MRSNRPIFSRRLFGDLLLCAKLSLLQLLCVTTDMLAETPDVATDSSVIEVTRPLKIACINVEEIETVLPQLKRLKKAYDDFAAEQQAKVTAERKKVQELERQLQTNQQVLSLSEQDQLVNEFLQARKANSDLEYEIQKKLMQMQHDRNRQTMGLLRQWANKAVSEVDVIITEDSVIFRSDRVINLTAKILEIAWEEERSSNFVEEEDSASKKDETDKTQAQNAA